MRVRIQDGLRYPLMTAPLLVIVIFSGLLWISIKAGLLGIWLGILLLAGIFNYGFVLLERASVGAEPPPLAVEQMNPVASGRTLMLLGTCAVIAGLSFASAAFATWLALIVGILGAALVPGMIASQAISGSAFHVLNLPSIARLIAATKQDYAQLALIFAGAILICALAFRSGAPLILTIALAIYAWLAIFSCVGCAIREYRGVTGFDDAIADEEVVALEDERTRERERARWLDRIYAQWRGGSVRNAMQTIDTEIDEAVHPLNELLWLYQQVSQWPDRRLSEYVAPPLLHRLLDDGRNGEALDIARTHLRINSGFRPLEGNDAIRLARLARDAGDRPTARTLLADFANIYPRDPAHTTAELLHRQLER
jgi:hypothetical protein